MYVSVSFWILILQYVKSALFCVSQEVGTSLVALDKDDYQIREERHNRDLWSVGLC